MVALVSAETVLLVLLVVLVAGLLRSHAEILRRVGPAGDLGGSAGGTVPDALAVPARAATGAAGNPAPALVGVTPSGDAVKLDFAGTGDGLTLLAFLSSGCGTCAGFWAGLAEPRLPRDVQAVIVTRGSEREQPATVRDLSPAGVAVVMSSQAWEDYRVPGAPYFVLAGATILGEGAAASWTAVSSLVSDAVREERGIERVPGGADPAGAVPRSSGAATRAGRIDDVLAAGGIGPGHPSLFPSGDSRAAPGEGPA